MQAEEIQTGDVLFDQGAVVYTVEVVSIEPPHVKAVVRYADGGNGVRLFEAGKDVPLARPIS